MASSGNDDAVDANRAEESGCELMDDFAIAIQLVLASVAFSSLFVKRRRERPQRPFIIWFLDASKQGIGACLVHALNVLTSLAEGQVSQKASNPCVWYFLNVALDTTIGVFVLFLWLQLFTHVASNIFRIQNLESGQYGDPPSTVAWLRQTAIFSAALFMTKVVVVIMFQLFPFLRTFASWILNPLRSDPRYEVAFVMLLFPMVMNVVQFWLIDTVIKGKLDQLAGSKSPSQEIAFAVDNEADSAEPLGSGDAAQESSLESSRTTESSSEDPGVRLIHSGKRGG